MLCNILLSIFLQYKLDCFLSNILHTWNIHLTNTINNIVFFIFLFLKCCTTVYYQIFFNTNLTGFFPKYFVHFKYSYNKYNIKYRFIFVYK